MSFVPLMILILGAVVSSPGREQKPRIDGNMAVILLGTGTPFVDAERFGAAVIVEAGGKKLLFDCGRGAVIRLKQAGIGPEEIDGVFVTHLHSDHIVAVPDLWLTGWFQGRKAPLKMWGPVGTRSMVEHLGEAFAFDIGIRSAHGLPRERASIDAQEVEDDKLYEVGPVRVTAFEVDHGPVKPAFGYRVDYGGHSVVISGDTNSSANLVNHAKGADCLIHSAWSTNAKDDTPPAKRSIATAEDAARVFSAVRPKLGAIYHYYDKAGLREAVRASYKGRFVVGQDLMRIDIDRTITWHALPYSRSQCSRVTPGGRR
jgi:ribonuclease Z